jgi:hypothetical protein
MEMTSLWKSHNDSHSDLELSLEEREIPTFPQRFLFRSQDKNVGEKGTS